MSVRLANLRSLKQAFDEIVVPSSLSDFDLLSDLEDTVSSSNKYLGAMTKNIDMFDKRISERSKKIEDLRRQSIEFLSELPTVDFKNESEGYKGSATFFEIENKISRIEKEKTHLENKREDEISKLHSRILWGQHRQWKT